MISSLNYLNFHIRVRWNATPCIFCRHYSPFPTFSLHLRIKIEVKTVIATKNAQSFVSSLCSEIIFCIFFKQIILLQEKKNHGFLQTLRKNSIINCYHQYPMVGHTHPSLIEKKFIKTYHPNSQCGIKLGACGSQNQLRTKS